jgi:hypothetical protein
VGTGRLSPCGARAWAALQENRERPLAPPPVLRLLRLMQVMERAHPRLLLKRFAPGSQCSNCSLPIPASSILGNPLARALNAPESQSQLVPGIRAE